MLKMKGSVLFDAISVGEVKATVLPGDFVPTIEATMFYVNSKTGVPCGSLILKHIPSIGLETLSEETLKAWNLFCRGLEKDQAKYVFTATEDDEGFDGEPGTGEQLKPGLGDP